MLRGRVYGVSLLCFLEALSCSSVWAGSLPSSIHSATCVPLTSPPGTVSPVTSLSVLSFNAGLLRLRLGSRSIVEVPFLRERRSFLRDALLGSGADVICLQEVFSRSDRDALYLELLEEYPHVVRFDDRVVLRRTHGLMVFSRLPLLASSFTSFAPSLTRFPFVHRGFLTAVLDVPLLGPLAVLNLHTTAGISRGPEASEVEAVRSRQLLRVHEAVESSSLPSLVCGDFNAGPEASPLNYELLPSLGYLDALAASGVTSPTWDPSNPLNCHGWFEGSPPQRIDHVFLSPSALPLLSPSAAAPSFAEPLVPTPIGLVPLSDHAGVFVELSCVPVSLPEQRPAVHQTAHQAVHSEALSAL